MDRETSQDPRNNVNYYLKQLHMIIGIQWLVRINEHFDLSSSSTEP